MLGVGAGSIVNTSSIAGLIGVRNSGAYTASKHGVAGLTKAAKVAGRGVACQRGLPGTIQTPMLDCVFAAQPERRTGYAAAEPMDRFAAPREVADVVFLCSDAASYLTGAAIPVNGDWAAG